MMSFINLIIYKNMDNIAVMSQTVRLNA